MPSPFPMNTDITPVVQLLLSHRFATTRSGLPSPFTSSTAIAIANLAPELNVEAVRKSASPDFSCIDESRLSSRMPWGDDSVAGAGIQGARSRNRCTSRNVGAGPECAFGGNRVAVPRFPVTGAFDWESRRGAVKNGSNQVPENSLMASPSGDLTAAVTPWSRTFPAKWEPY